MTAPHITTRSRKYDPALYREINALEADDLAERAARWRDNAADPIHGTPFYLAIAAYFQSIADRKRAAVVDEVTFEPMCSGGCPGSYLEQTNGRHLPDCDQYR